MTYDIYAFFYAVLNSICSILWLSLLFWIFGIPDKKNEQPPTVGELLYEEMSSLGWENVDNWKQQAEASDQQVRAMKAEVDRLAALLEQASDSGSKKKVNCHSVR